MNAELFSLLEESMQQATKIASGEREAARVTKHEIPDVKSIRERLGVTQDEFANTIKASTDTVSKWEQGKRNPTGSTALLIKLIEHDLGVFETLKLLK